MSDHGRFGRPRDLRRNLRRSRRETARAGHWLDKTVATDLNLCDSRLLLHLLLRLGGWTPAVGLLHQGKQVSDAPVVRDLSVPDTHHINRFELNLAMRRGNSHKRAVVSSLVGLVRGDTVSVHKLPVDLGVKIGEGFRYVRIEPPHACLVRSHSSSWLFASAGQQRVIQQTPRRRDSLHLTRHPGVNFEVGTILLGYPGK